MDMFSKATRRRSKTRTDTSTAMMMMGGEESRDSSLLPEMILVKPEPLDMEGVIVPIINIIEVTIKDLNKAKGIVQMVSLPLLFSRLICYC